MPKTPSGEWGSAASDEAEYTAFVDRVGNLTLIEDTANKVAGNASFSQKKTKAFSQSGITMTKDLCEYDQWTVTEISERQRRLAKIAVQVWAISF